jgi:branched-chain amino acid transport system permease protein
MLGLVNGSFYAMLSLGLAVIFGLLGVVNFAHGAFYMLGAFAACWLQWFGINYWAALILAPLASAARHRRGALFLRRLYKLDPSVRPAADLRPGAGDRGLLPNCSAASGQSYPVPACCRARSISASCILPIYRAWVILVLAGGVLSRTWFLIERTRSARRCAPRPRTRRWCRPSASTCR